MGGWPAGFFIELGLAPGNRIAIQLPNAIEAPLALLAAWHAGRTVCAIRCSATPKTASEPRALIGVGEVARLREVAAEAISVAFVLGFGRHLPDGVIDLDAAATQQADATPVEGRRLEGSALVTFTGRAGAPLLRCSPPSELLAQGVMTVMALNRRDVILLHPSGWPRPPGAVPGDGLA